MTKNVLIIMVSSVIMLSSLMKAFGMTNQPSGMQLYARKIDLSGNVFRFEIPEDFSRDMPAEDLIERLDIKSSEELRNDHCVILMRRWWDIKKPGFWGKNMGAVMMSIAVRARPENQVGVLKAKSYDFHHMLHFVVALYDSLEQRYRDDNKETGLSEKSEFSVFIPSLVTQIGETIYSNYKEILLSEKNTWIVTGIGIGHTGQINKLYAIPLSENNFLEIEFALMPNDDVVAREFSDLAMIRVNKIVETFAMQYAEGNEYNHVTAQDWMGKTVLGELESNQNQFSPGLRLRPVTEK